ncbi:MAG: hypothetical protein V7637_1506 [Mycobacteriales bacterium]
MSVLYGQDGLQDVRAAGHGLLTDPAAVFGLGSDMFADPPGWLASRAEVNRRLAAKPAEDGVNPTHWPGVVELARCCGAVADDVSDCGAAPVEVIHRALTLSTALSRRLPHPPVALVDAAAFPASAVDLFESGLIGAEDADAPDGPVGIPVGHTYLLNYWQDRLREQACRLADMIGDQFWTDPDALAGIVDDTRRVLAAYFVTAYELGALPPAPRRPLATHTVRRRAAVTRFRDTGQRRRHRH